MKQTITEHRKTDSDLKLICELAMQEGQKIDLTGCNYGKTTGPSQFINRPTKYYYFLAGLVKTQNLTKILEIGTNSGGSIMSMDRGINKENPEISKLVTVDIEYQNHDGLKDYTNIERITGDALDQQVVNKVKDSFTNEIDLLYIDSLHEYDHTKKNIEIYGQLLNPKLIVLDDIRQCEDMVKLWDELKAEYKHKAFDASGICKRGGAGFGVIKYSDHKKQ